MIKNFSSNQNNNNDVSSDSSNNDSGFPDIDINMIMKIKSIMDSMKSGPEDPRANLLRSLKPYLKDSRKDKVDQYVQFFKMGKVFEMFNPLGGDSSK